MDDELKKQMAYDLEKQLGYALVDFEETWADEVHEWVDPEEEDAFEQVTEIYAEVIAEVLGGRGYAK